MKPPYNDAGTWIIIVAVPVLTLLAGWLLFR